jgi:DNA helicase-2/ATP-dependent DNA helicase PcrA
MLREWNLPTLQTFDINLLPDFQAVDDDLGRTYSYTGDYLSYLHCPRSYMLFERYGFIPSRSQTMFFGNLIHHTIEDLHYLLIEERTKKQARKNDAVRE